MSNNFDIKRKVGRNEPCPCGSGLKFKKCHGLAETLGSKAEIPAHISKGLLQRLEGIEKERQQQQGLGRPIISLVFKGYRMVAVGHRLYYAKEDEWKTFNDFLNSYIKQVFGKDWGNAELAKKVCDRHPVMQWYDHLCKEQRKVNKTEWGLIETKTTGAIFAYVTLAYNLYLIAHNIHLVHGEGLHARLIDRLRDSESFYPAFYETMVAALFIKAGFQIELENEDDPSSHHAEFTATSPKTGRKYSVEAKHRQAGKGHTAIKKQLVKALKKNLSYMHIVFINLNVPENMKSDGRLKWLGDVICQMRNYENTITPEGKPAPQAYVFVTNHPFLYNLDSFAFSPAAVAEGFRIPDFKIDCAFSNLRDALKSREKHIDMLDLMKAMKEYDQIPCTFDGTIAEYSFGEITTPRLVIGNKYLVPDGSGKEVEGILEDAVVMENERKVWGLYRLDNGKQIMATCPLSEQEYMVFKQHPDTFFGVHKKHPNRTKDALDLYDFFHGVYQKTPKYKLLQFMQGDPDHQTLKNKSQEELAVIYCERLVYSAMNQQRRHKSN